MLFYLRQALKTEMHFARHKQRWFNFILNAGSK